MIAPVTLILDACSPPVTVTFPNEVLPVDDVDARVTQREGLVVPEAGQTLRVPLLVLYHS